VLAKRELAEMNSPERRGFSLSRVGLSHLAVALCLTGVPSGASAAASAQFTVAATLVSADVKPASGFCTSGPGKSTYGAVVTVVCETGVVVDIEAPRTAVSWTALHGGAYRYWHAAENELPGSRSVGGLDSYTGSGTITSWRMVSLADSDYVEMQISW
jgi:hypothetical protein